MKKLKILFCSLIMMLLFSSYAYANEEIETNKVSFEEFITPYFESDNTQVFDRNGNDITIDFFARNKTFYLAGDFKSIKEYSDKKVGIFRAHKEVETISPFGFNQTRHIESYEAKYINYSKGSAHASGYVKVTIGGNYVYNPESGIIVSAYNPTVKRVEYEDFREWKMSYTNLSTKASISSNKFYALFSASLTVHGKYEYGGIVWNENMGRITATVQGDASGVVD